MASDRCLCCGTPPHPSRAALPSCPKGMTSGDVAFGGLPKPASCSRLRLDEHSVEASTSAESGIECRRLPVFPAGALHPSDLCALGEQGWA